MRQTLARPFAAVGSFLDMLSGAVSMAHDADRVAKMSDADLAAKGMTRAEAIQNVFK